MCSVLKVLYVLRRRIASSVRGLIIRTFCADVSAMRLVTNFFAGACTVTVYCAMCAGLLAITLDFLSSTFVAGPSHSPALLVVRRTFASGHGFAIS